MSRDEMIQYLHEHPGARVTHSLFSSDEWLTMRDDGYVYDEQGYLFEDWYSDRNGLRMRSDDCWLEGWSIVE